MITLKLTHGLSHDNGYVCATQKHPYVTVEDEAIAKFCIDSGYFVRVDGNSAAPAAPAAPNDEQPTDPAPAVNGGENAAPAAPADDTDELEAMTVSELKAYAETVGIELGKATKKADIIAIIREEEAKA